MKVAVPVNASTKKEGLMTPTNAMPEEELKEAVWPNVRLI